MRVPAILFLGAVFSSACGGDDSDAQPSNDGGGSSSLGGQSSGGNGATSGSSGSGGIAGADGTGGTGTGGASGSGTGGVGGTGGVACDPDPPLPSGALTRSPSNPVLMNGPENYDYDKTGPRAIVKVATGDYRMWYEAVNQGNTLTTAALATSSDGISWVKQGPVMQPVESWEGNEISPNSIVMENGGFRLYYHAGGNVEPHRNIGTATSTDGKTWTRAPTPVLTVGSAGSFDDDEVAEPRVFKLGAKYRMYYTGKKSGGTTSLGMAESNDGVSFTKSSANPVLDASEWGNFWGGAFFFEAGRWLLWRGVASNGGSALHFASSSDGLVWTNGGANPVLSQNTDSGAPDNGLVGDSVSGFRDGDVIRIYYTGYNENLFGSLGRFEGICMASIAAPAPCP